LPKLGREYAAFVATSTVFVRHLLDSLIWLRLTNLMASVFGGPFQGHIRARVC
jgi:hypothetical protein